MSGVPFLGACSGGVGVNVIQKQKKMREREPSRENICTSRPSACFCSRERRQIGTGVLGQVERGRGWCERRRRTYFEDDFCAAAVNHSRRLLYVSTSSHMPTYLGIAAHYYCDASGEFCQVLSVLRNYLFAKFQKPREATAILC